MITFYYLQLLLLFCMTCWKILQIARVHTHFFIHPWFLFVFLFRFAVICEWECCSAEFNAMNQLIKSICIAMLFLFLSAFCSESKLRVGKAINVFVRYGYLGISMKVISYNDTERWLFKEPTTNVFRVSTPTLLCGYLNICVCVFETIEVKCFMRWFK